MSVVTSFSLFYLHKHNSIKADYKNKTNATGEVNHSVFHLFPLHAVSVCSTSQRGVAWVPHRTGGRGRMRPHLSKRRDLLTARTAMASVSNPWSSTWLASTSWKANNPGSSHFPCPLFSQGAAHSQPHLFLRTCSPGNTTHPSSSCTHPRFTVEKRRSKVSVPRGSFTPKWLAA